jgi:antitoxin PrlF
VDGDQVTVRKANEREDDPVVGKFLDFLAKDVERHPAAVKPLSRTFAARLSSLTKGKKVDLDELIEGSVDL